MNESVGERGSVTWLVGGGGLRLQLMQATGKTLTAERSNHSCRQCFLGSFDSNIEELSENPLYRVDVGDIGSSPEDIGRWATQCGHVTDLGDYLYSP